MFFLIGKRRVVVKILKAVEWTTSLFKKENK